MYPYILNLTSLTTKDMIENIIAALIASLTALTSAGVGTDAFVAATPRAQAQVSQSTSSDFNLDWRSWGDWRGNKPVVRDIEPEEGPVGTTVTLTGNRFSDDSIVRFGEGVINDPEVSSNGRTLSFTVPSEIGKYCPPNQACTLIAYEVDPGDYNVRVQNGNRVSNAVTFEVTEDDTSDDLAILAIDGPTALETGAEGTWTLDVESDGDEDLQYSVKWGDEGWSPLRLLSIGDEEVQSSAIFTHTYSGEGTYYPEFTVTNESGDSVTKVSEAVVVSDEMESVPHISSSTPDSGPAGTTVILAGSGFDSDSTVKLGETSATDVAVLSESEITFIVPDLEADDYAVAVTDDDGTSNEITFTVTQEGSVSVSGLDAPTRLAVNEEGTWTVHADTSSSGNLKYSVAWGENAAARMMSLGDTTQSSATFTHTYGSEGTYQPTFTVTDEYGNSAKVSASVVVEDTEE